MLRKLLMTIQRLCSSGFPKVSDDSYSRASFLFLKHNLLGNNSHITYVVLMPKYI